MNKVILSEAPGRICLFGDHQDYLQLPVIACAIDRKLRIKAIPNDKNYFLIHKIDLDQSVKIPLSPPEKKIASTDYLQTALKVLKRYACIPSKGYDVQISGNIPINAGLSSSSALTISWIQFLIEAFGINTEITSNLVAQLAYETEVLEHGTSGGKMDQFTIALGNMIYLNTKDDSYITFLKPIGQLVIGVSGLAKDTFGTLSFLKENALKSINQVREKIPSFEISSAQLLNLEEYLNFVSPELKPFLTAAITNYDITLKAKQELDKINPNIVTIGDLMNQHHEQLKENLKITPLRINNMISAVIKAGACGAKIVGSGGGGCIVALTNQNNTDELIQSLKDAGAVDAFVVSQSSGSESKRICT